MTPEEKRIAQQRLCHVERPTCHGFDGANGCNGCLPPLSITQIWEAGEAAERERCAKIAENYWDGEKIAEIIRKAPK